MLVEQSLPDHFRGFAAVAERDGCTTYAAICRGVAADEEVLSLLDGAPLPQRRPLLLLAAVHSLLLRGADDPLAAFYDTVGAVRDMERRPTGDVAVAFASFCRAHRPDLEHLIATRTTQTNEVGRCTALFPGLCHISASYGGNEPLSLLDLGTSAGLNLLFDDYGYTYRAQLGDAVLTAGPARSGVALECEARDDLTHLPDLRTPAMAERVGLDLSPLDPRDDDDALMAARLSVAGQPGALRPAARRAGQRPVGRATPAPRAGRHDHRPAAGGGVHWG